MSTGSWIDAAVTPMPPLGVASAICRYTSPEGRVYIHELWCDQRRWAWDTEGAFEQELAGGSSEFVHSSGIVVTHWMLLPEFV